MNYFYFLFSFRLSLVDVLEHATAVVLSQSTTKIFKSDVRGKASRSIRVRVADGALIAFIEHPTTLFSFSKYTQHLSLEAFSPHASACIVDWYTGGRGEQQDGFWNCEYFRNELELKVAGSVEYRENIKLSGGDALKRHMRDYGVLCTVLLYGSKLKALGEKLLSSFASRHAFSLETEYRTPAQRKMSSSSNSDLAAPVKKEELELITSSSQLLVSCCRGPSSGLYILRVCAQDIETATVFLWRYVGNLGGLLPENPFRSMLYSDSCAPTGVSLSHNPESVPPLSPPLHHEKNSQSLHPLITPPKCRSRNLAGIARDGEVWSDSLSEEQCPDENCRRTISDLSLKRSKSSGGRGGGGMGRSMNDLLVWQLIDSKLPTGGFVHSCGIEVAQHIGLIQRRDGASLRQFILDILQQTATSLIPFVAACYEAGTNTAAILEDAESMKEYVELKRTASNGTDFAAQCRQSPTSLSEEKAKLRRREGLLYLYEQFSALDSDLDVTLGNQLARDASLTQGISLLKTAMNTFSNIAGVLSIVHKCAAGSSPYVQDGKQKSSKETSSRIEDAERSSTSFEYVRGHLAVVYGIVCGLLLVSKTTCLHMFLYSTLRNLILAAVRLNIIGPMEGERLQYELGPTLVSLAGTNF